MKLNRRSFFSLLAAPLLARLLPAKAESIPISKQFAPRYFSVEVVEDIDVLNVGDRAVFKLLEADMEEAFDTMSRLLAEDWYFHGPHYDPSLKLSREQRVFNPSRLPV